MSKRICACGCARELSERTERRHLNGKGPASLSLHVLLENPWAVKRPIKKRTPKHRETQALSGSSCKQGVYDAPPLPQDNDVTMHDNATPFEPVDEAEEQGYVLSATRRSSCIATKIAQIHECHWGPGSQELIREDDEEPEDENLEDENPLIVGEDEDEEVKEDDSWKLTCATPGLEGIPLLLRVVTLSPRLSRARQAQNRYDKMNVIDHKDQV
ncbi:hypothetical protein JOM56_009083 [Amanita muscaria]